MIWFSRVVTEEHPLAVAEVGDRKNRRPRPAVVAVEDPLDVERRPLEPGGEGRLASSPLRFIARVIRWVWG